MRPDLKKALHQAIADYKELTLKDQILRAKMEAAGANMLVYEERIGSIVQEGKSELMEFILSTLEAEAGISSEPEASAIRKNYLN